jgi:aspartate aminotransferase
LYATGQDLNMFEALQPLQSDPILGLMAAYNADPNPRKVDLGVGVYKNAAGHTPVLESVKLAESWLLTQQQSKAYVGPAGAPAFNAAAQQLLLGQTHAAIADGRAVTLQTPGGCGALRAGAELIKRARPQSRIWVSDPTWANHLALLGSVGLAMREYPYYDSDAKLLCFDAMMSALAEAQSGDVVLLHACCHNPCGSDLDLEQWRALSQLLVQRGLVPFIDVAYQGFGHGIEQDVAGLRLVVSAVPEALIAASFSKNFGLYRDRTGCLTVIASNQAQADIARNQVGNTVRGLWSMPPDHGAAVVAHILTDAALRERWEGEVVAMRERINTLRRRLVRRLADLGAGDFSYIAAQQGMFSFLGLRLDQVARLRSDFSIYLVDSSRINVAGLNDDCLDYVCAAVREVCA